MFDIIVRDEILQLRRDGARWLSTGWNGGEHETEAAYNISVPEGWDRTDIDVYVEERLNAAEFIESGPALLTGVDMCHLRGARLGPAVAYATAGVSNPAALPMYKALDTNRQQGSDTVNGDSGGKNSEAYSRPGQGTVNILVGTDRQLSSGGRANLLTVVAEAKAATLLELVGIPGTTTDAIIVGDTPAGESTQFTGSATPVGDAVRACVRDALCASLASRYEHEEMPQSVEEAEYGITTNRQAEVFSP